MAQDLVVDVAIGLIQKGRRFLIAQRQPDAHLGSFWEFPGGKVNSGESPQVAVTREIQEEVGLAVRVIGLFHTEIADYPERTVRLHFFLCQDLDPRVEAKSLAATQLAWVLPESFDDYIFPKGNQALLVKLKCLANECC